MLNQFSRTELLLGKEAMEILQNARVAVFGVGGVGGYVVEALARSGVGTFDLVDDDQICLSNLNRQIIATTKTIGRDKVDVMKERILDINPLAIVHVHKCFFLPETKDEFPFSEYSYVVDAVDTVTAKIELVLQAQAANVPIISSMGAGNKLNPAEFEVTDIYKTSVCPLAKVMRRELKKRGVRRLKVVYSKEKPLHPIEDMVNDIGAAGKEPANCKTDGDEVTDRQLTCRATDNSQSVESGHGTTADGQSTESRHGFSADSQSAKSGHGFSANGQSAKPGHGFSADNQSAGSGHRDAVRRSIPGSNAFVPPVAGLIIASEVIKDLTREATARCRGNMDDAQ